MTFEELEVGDEFSASFKVISKGGNGVRCRILPESKIFNFINYFEKDKIPYFFDVKKAPRQLKVGDKYHTKFNRVGKIMFMNEDVCFVFYDRDETHRDFVYTSIPTKQFMDWIKTGEFVIIDDSSKE